MSSKYNSPKPKSVEEKAARAVMLELNLTVVDLAARCGKTRDRLSKFLNGAKTRTPQLGYLIEAKGFGYSRPIWSSPELLLQRQTCLSALGIDPYLIPAYKLRRMGKDVGADFSRCLTLEDMRREVIARAAVRLTSKPKTLCS